MFNIFAQSKNTVMMANTGSTTPTNAQVTPASTPNNNTQATPTQSNLSNKTKIAAGATITSALAASGVGGYAAYQKFIKTVKVEGFTDKFSNLINQTAFGTVSSNPILKDLATKPEYSKLLDALKTQKETSLQSFLTNNSIEKIQSTITTLNGNTIALEAIKNEKLSALFAGNGLNFPGLNSKDFGSLFSKGQLDKYTTNPEFINQFSQVKDLEGLNTLLNSNNLFSPNQKNILRQLIDKNPEQFTQLQETLKQISTLNKNDLQLLSDVLGKPEALTLLNGSSIDFLQMSANPQIQALFADPKILELMQKQEFTQLLNNAGLSEVLNHSQLTEAMNSPLLSEFNKALSGPSAAAIIGVAAGLLGLTAILGAVAYGLFKSDKKEAKLNKETGEHLDNFVNDFFPENQVSASRINEIISEKTTNTEKINNIINFINNNLPRIPSDIDKTTITLLKTHLEEIQKNPIDETKDFKEILALDSFKQKSFDDIKDALSKPNTKVKVTEPAKGVNTTQQQSQSM